MSDAEDKIYEDLKWAGLNWDEGATCCFINFIEAFLSLSFSPSNLMQVLMLGVLTDHISR